MPTRRYRPGVAALGNKIFVTGGRTGQIVSNSADCYDTDTNTWSQVANMNSARMEHTLVCKYGRLYAIGGHQAEESVEVYDPDNNTWTLIQHIYILYP